MLARPKEEYPLRPGYSGHECAGLVEESDVPDFEPGDRVLDVSRDFDAFNEYHLRSPDDLIKLPEGYDLGALLMTQVLGTIVHCCYKWENILGKDAVVLGQGPVGLLFTAMLRNMGARKIIGVDLLDYRLKVAQEMGTTHVINASQTDPTSAVADLTGGEMADLVVEAVGLESTYNQTFDLVKRNGSITFFGVPKVDPMVWNVRSMFRKEAKTVSSAGPDKGRDFPMALFLITQGRVDVAPLLTHRIPFREVQKAFEMAEKKLDGVVKVIIEF